MYVLLLAFAIQPFDSVGANINLTTSYYSLHAQELQGLNDELNQRAVDMGEAGHTKHSAALTQSSFVIEYVAEELEGFCKIQSYRVDVDITTSLPRWHPQAAPDERDMTKWLEAQTALHEHERTHQLISIDAAHRIYAELGLIEPQKSCGHLAFAVERIKLGQLSRMQWRDQAHDRYTNNGLNAGTRIGIERTRLTENNLVFY